MLFPFARTPATTWRISSIVPTDFMLEAVLGVWIGAASNIARPAANRRANLLRHLGVALEKLRLERVVQAEHVRQHQNLAITLRARSDADCGNADGGGDACGDSGRHELEHYRERARLLEPFCLADQSLRSYL